MVIFVWVELNDVNLHAGHVSLPLCQITTDLYESRKVTERTYIFSVRLRAVRGHPRLLTSATIKGHF